MKRQKSKVDFFISQPPKNWEEAWLKNRANYDNIVLYAVCQNKECKERYHPVTDSISSLQDKN